MKKFLKFSASWCHQCAQLSKILKDCDLPIQEIDVDDDSNEHLVEKFKIRSMPTIVLVDEDYNELARFNGIVTIDKLKEEYNK